MEQEIKKYDWVDALRGYAILLVMMIHTSLIFLGNSFHLEMITRVGDLGVTMFFIASSYTLFNSYKNRQAIDGDKAAYFFFIRRFFRIAPLYYLAIIGYVAVGFFYHSRWVKTPIELGKVIANFSFLNGIYLPAINYIPPGGWSVGVEMLFYLTIPLLFSKIKNVRKAFVFLVSSIVGSFLIQILLYFLISHYTKLSWELLRGWYLYFWFPNQFPVFCFGILLFFVIQIKIHYQEWLLALSIALIVLLSFFNFQLSFPKFLIQREYLYSIAFFLFAFSLSRTNLRFMIKPINKLGKVSFSAYLIHFIVIEIIWKIFKNIFHGGPNSDINFVLVFICVVITTYFLSKMTYRIEKIGISTGESLIKRIKENQLPK